MKKFANISFSGGETSAYMTKWLLENKKGDYDFVVTFANTGQEAEETLDFVDRCDREFGFNLHWVEAVPQEGRKGTTYKEVNFRDADRNGEPFEAVIRKYGIPNKSFPHCSRELKTRPIHAFAKHWFGTTDYITFIGIRSDEIDRMSDDPKFAYPLVDLGITKPKINSFWDAQPFRLNLKGYEGNCKTCWKKSKRKLLTIAQERPSWFDFFSEMELKYECFVPKTLNPDKYKTPARFFRNYESCSDLLREAKETYFKKAEDDKFIFAHPELDLEGACGSESCESF